MTKQLNIFTIKDYYRLKNSVCGNPRYSLTLEDEDGNTYEAKTQTDAMCGYMIGWGSVNKSYLMQYHYTKAGAMVIVYMIESRELLYSMYARGGYRERYAMENGKSKRVKIGDHDCIRYHYSRKHDRQDANGATYSITAGAWIG